MQEVATIGSVSISTGWENDQAILVLNNRGQNREVIDFLCLESGSSHSVSWKNLQLPFGHQRKVKLPEGFERWERFGFHIGEKRLLAPATDLRRLLDKAKNQMKIDTSRPRTEPSISKPEQLSKLSPKLSRNNAEKSNKTRSKRSNIIEHTLADYPHEAEKAVQDAREQAARLARAYRDGEPIDFVDLETPTSSQKVLLILNSLARDISQWRAELEQSGEVDSNLVDTLTFRESDIKDKLKAVRGETPPVPNLLNLETDISTDTELNHIRNQCALYMARFEGRLFDHEERCKIDDLAEYNKFIPQFIKDRLFNGVARFVQFDRLSEQLDKFLQLVGYKVVSIEIGKTKADARVHEIQGSRQIGVEPGTIIEVVLPGLRRITDGKIVQKPVVIRGE